MTTFLSVCDGLGCANLAFSPLGWKQVLSSEIDAAPRSTLAHHLGAADARRTLPAGFIPLWGDFTALRVRHLRRMGVRLPDVLCGGTPCQSYSVAGKRGGLSDPRGELTIAFLKLLDALDAARLADGLPPVLALWENVPGVLNHPDNPFGHVLSGLVGEDSPIRPAGGKWSDAGLAVGPSRAAAWRVLDAQYFGLAQRRERVFVVASAREGFDPAAILFEPDRVRRHSPPSRETGEGATPTVTGGARQRGGYSHDDVPLTSATLTAGYGERAGQDFDKPDALIAFDTTQITSVANRSVPKSGDPCHPLAAGAHPPAIAFTCKDHGGDATSDLAPTLRAMGHADSHANAGGQLAVAFALPILESGKRTGASATSTKAGDGIGADGDPMFTLGTDSRHAVAFALRGRDGGAMPEVEGDGDTVGTLRAAEGGSSRDYVAIPINPNALRGEGSAKTPSADAEGRVRLRDPGLGVGRDGDPADTLTAAGPGAVATTAAVRRLTPMECCRLQGVPDDYFDAVLHRGKPLADGPIYKMLGNGWAVPVVAWLGERIAAELATSDQRRAA